MRLNLKQIIHVPGASVPFDVQLDLSDLDFFGSKPITKPLRVHGIVENRAEVLWLEGEAVTELSLTCDRCMKKFAQEKYVSLNTMLATQLENEENDEIVLLEGDELDLGELATSAFVLGMDTKNLCSDDCKGICSGCGVNLNEGACRCKPEVDPRLAALAQLLDEKS